MNDDEYLSQQAMIQINTALATIHSCVDAVSTLAATAHAAMSNLHHIIDVLTADDDDGPIIFTSEADDIQ